MRHTHFFYQLLLAVLLTGIFAMPISHAEALKPSETRSLAKAQEALEQVQATLNENTTDLDDRKRALKKAQSSLKRTARSFERLPQDHGDVAAGLETTQALIEQLAAEQAELEQDRSAQVASNEAAEAQMAALISAPETVQNIERMNALSLQLRDVWQMFHRIDDRFTHGLFKIQDEQAISLLIYTLEQQAELQEEATLLLETYEPLARTAQGARTLLAPTKDLRQHVEEFVTRLPDFVAGFPAVQVATAEAFTAEVIKQKDIFRNANKERDTSALLNLNPRFPQLDFERNRMEAHERIYGAINGPHSAEIQRLRSEALALADAVGDEITQWQVARKGAEAKALAEQQAKYEEQSRRNAQQAEADRIAWEERRAKLDAQREAQQARNAQLRKIKR